MASTAGISQRGRCLLAVAILLVSHAASQAMGQGLLGFTEKTFGANRQCVTNKLREFDRALQFADGLEGKGGGSGGRGVPRYADVKNRPKVKVQARMTSGDDAAFEVEACASKAAVGEVASDAIFHLATMPAKYMVPLPYVRDQGTCQSCVGMAMAGLVEASVANAIGRTAKDVPRLNARYLQYCGLDGPKHCKQGMDLKRAIDGATRYDDDGKQYVLKPCYQVQDIPKEKETIAARLCNAAKSQCKVEDSGFTCLPKSMDSIQEMQAEIASGQPVISGMQIYSSFRSFFDKNPKGIYNETGSCRNQSQCEPHAVLVVGYDNTVNAWSVLNSWNSSFGDQGVFRIAYGTAELGLPSQTYGLICRPTGAGLQLVKQRRLQLKPLPQEPGCYNHTVNTARTPTLSSIAWQLGVSITKIVAKNPSVFKLYSRMFTVNITDSGSSSSSADQSECFSGLSCGRQDSSSICRTAVALDPEAKPARYCNVTWQLPNLSVPLDGKTLKVCGIDTLKFQDEDVAVVVCPPGFKPTDKGEACIEECSPDSEDPACQAKLATNQPPNIYTGCPRSYEVKKGESLEMVANNFSTTTEAIMAINPVIPNKNTLIETQVINLPPCQLAKERCKTVHKLRMGESLFQLAMWYGNTTDQIRQENPSLPPADNALQSGQQINIWHVCAEGWKGRSN